MRRNFPWLLGLSASLLACAENAKVPTDAASDNKAGALVTATQSAEEPLLTLVLAPILANEQKDFLSRVRARASSAEINVGRLSTAAVSLLQPGKAVVFQLSQTLQTVTVGRSLVQRAPNDLSWTGTIGNNLGSVQLVLTSKGITADIRTSVGLYHVEPIGGGLHAMTRIDNFPPEHPPEFQSGATRASAQVVPKNAQVASSPFTSHFPLSPPSMKSTQVATMSPIARIDVLVAYTPSAAAATLDINGLIQLAFDEANTSYSNSAINLRIAPAYVAQVSYTESGRTYPQHVAALQSPADGIMDVVHTWRDQFAADVVLLVVNDTSSCGIASQVLADEATAFAVVHYSCATGNYSFAHEIGHLQGAQHDRSSDPGNGPFQYGHGYVEPNLQWRTIMAYPQPCSNCARVQYWSNPNVTYPPTGQVMGTTTFENNASVLDQTKSTMALFRGFPTSISGTSPIRPGNTCYYYASASGGTAPYTYTWSWTTNGGGTAGGNSPNNGTFLLVAQTSATYTINLKVLATDANGSAGTLTKTVEVSPTYGYSC